MSSAYLSSTLPMRVRDVARHAWQINRPLVVFAIASLITLLVAVVGIIIDPRAPTAAPGWIKPLKFAISLFIYSATFLWLLRYVQGFRRSVAVIATLTAVMSALELVIITMQVVRGTYSHFNAITPFDNILFSIMGAAIVVLWLMCLGLGVLLLIQRIPNPVLAWGLRLGILTALVGMAVGFLMTGPKGDQLSANAAGGQPALVGAHTVGAPDGGPGLPLVGWSTTHGDLRVPHFIGMHGMQAIPLLAFLLMRLPTPWLGIAHRVAFVATGGASYLAFTGLLTWQALRAQPFLAPDILTLSALATLIIATGIVTGGILAHARLTGTPRPVTA